MSNNPNDPFDPEAWKKQTPPAYNQQVPPTYNQQVPPNYNQQYPPNYNQQVPPGGYQQFPPQGGYQQMAPGGFQPYGANFAGQIDLPSAGNAQVCGIIGLVLFWNLIGIILNIVAVVTGGNALREYQRFPGRYTESSMRKARAGRTCGTIGLCLLGLFFIIVVLAVAANS